MLTALFISCIVSTTDVKECSVSFTEMEFLSPTSAQCDINAKQIQQAAVDGMLLEFPGTKVVRQEAKCGERIEMYDAALDTYNELIAQGIPTELFEF